MSAQELLKARLLVAQADRSKKSARKAAHEEKENRGGRGAKGGKGGKGGQATAKKRKAATVSWAKAEFHPLTDKLLTIIEDKASYKQAFGFNKGHSESVSTGGLRPIELYTQVAMRLFGLDSENDDTDVILTYTTDDLPDLAQVVKNRISNLKKAYQEHHEKLGATGHGLVAAGKEDEIIEDTPIANAWEKISKKFPWYKRMDRLMGTSPIVNRSAVAHSGTRVDLGILDRKGTAHDGPMSLDSDDDSASKISGWSESSPTRPARRATLRDPDAEDEAISIHSSSPLQPTTPAAKVKTEPHSVTASTRGVKRKSVHDRIEEVASQDRSQRLKLAEVREEHKTVRARAKYDAKSSLEIARMQHQQREAERQREHELLMMKHQMQLEAMRRHQAAPAGAYDAGAPAYGAPPPDQFIDPRFRA
ncbi:hypothetical protein C8R44DRAFT_886369 [Mycena epipterygia]|nr:hypothetical protein C8R44DRAFT_886369 [Mycena epipterygia]